MKRPSPVPARAVRASGARLRAGVAMVAILTCAAFARAGDPSPPDALVGEWSVDLDATTKGLSESVALELDALSPADRAEEMLRRETFLKALRFVASADGTFVLGLKGDDTRATRGTWIAKGAGRYGLTVDARFGVPTPKAEAGPFEARVDRVRDRRDPDGTRKLFEPSLTFRDLDGTRFELRRPLAPGVAAEGPVPPPPSAPAPVPPTPVATPSPTPVPGAHPAAYVAAWELDRDRMVDVALALARKQAESLDADQRKLLEAMLDGDVAREGMRHQLEAMQIEVDLRADGTLEATLALPGKDAEKATGTWQETDGKASLVLTTKDGKPASETDRRPVNGRLDGGLLWLEMPGDATAIPLRKLVR